MRTQTCPDHAAAAEAAREQPRVWVHAHTYPTVDSAQSAARRVPLTRNLSAYRPIGHFQGYAARADGGGALWVRYVGDDPAPESIPAQMTVRVPTLLGDGPGYEGTGIVTVSVLPYCPRCGGPRGYDRITPDPFVRDGRRLVRDKWTNRCGHADLYEDVVKEAARMRVSAASYSPETAPALKRPEIAVDCPKCGARAGTLCMSHDGTRPRLMDVHRLRTEAWVETRIAAAPAAALVHEAANGRHAMHGRQAAALLAREGYAAEARLLDTELTLRRGHLSAREAVALLVEHAQLARGGETR